MAGPLTQQIAASHEEVQALLADNRSLSIAFLARRIRDHEDDTRKRFAGIHCPCKAIQDAEAAITKLEQRIEQASVKFREMREELDALKATKKTAKNSP